MRSPLNLLFAFTLVFENAFAGWGSAVGESAPA